MERKDSIETPKIKTKILDENKTIKYEKKKVKDKSWKWTKRALSAKQKISDTSIPPKAEKSDKYLEKLLNMLKCSNLKQVCVKVQKLLNESSNFNNIIGDLKDKIRDLEFPE